MNPLVAVMRVACSVSVTKIVEWENIVLIRGNAVWVAATIAHVHWDSIAANPIGVWLAIPPSLPMQVPCKMPGRHLMEASLL